MSQQLLLVDQLISSRPGEMPELVCEATSELGLEPILASRSRQDPRLGHFAVTERLSIFHVFADIAYTTQVMRKAPGQESLMGSACSVAGLYI